MVAMRVALHAHVDPGSAGGVQQAAIGVVAAFSKLSGDDDYAILARGGAEWLAPYIQPPCRLVPQRRNLGAALLARLRPTSPRVSDGTSEALGADVVHFLTQEAFLTDLPSIYQPWDLQHAHLPEFFSRKDRVRRDSLFRAYSQAASLVVVASKWGRSDFVEWSGVPEDRVRVVPLASILELYGPSTEEDDRGALDRLQLDTPFALYPARPWPHKNHDRLLDAIALLSRRGTAVTLVCTGEGSEEIDRLRARCRTLGIESHVRFEGFVADGVLAALYRRARLLIFPSLFEGFGLPVLEAMSVGLPMVSSRSTSLGELVGDAGIQFDPTDTDDMAHAIVTAWTDDALLRSLSAKGLARAANYSWSLTALRYRALYREVLGQTLNEADEALVAETAAP